MDNTESHSTVDVLTDIPWQLLEEITNGFSEKQIIGKGGFGTVYKAKYQNGQEIAVKKLYDMPGLDEKQYQNELQNLTGLFHLNIVRLIGKGYREQDRIVKYDGRLVVAQVIDRVICLEYVAHGSLQNHLYDVHSGFPWHKRYKLIKGISEGLKYLHEHSISHLDLKPGNILLDNDMVPKIADFGLSRLFSGTRQSHTTSHSIGTQPYMPPEYIEHGKISYKFDVFSLGVIIIQIMTGPDGYSLYADMPQEFGKQVHENWKQRLQQTGCRDASYLDAYCNQVKNCIDIALKSLEAHRQKRPTIEAIVSSLNGTESAIDEMYKKLFVIQPLKLRFPFEPDKMILCPLHLTNNTDDQIAFRIQQRKREIFAGSLKGVVPGKSTQTYILKMQKQQQEPSDVDSILIQGFVYSDFHGVHSDPDFDQRHTHDKMIDVTTTSLLDSSSQSMQEPEIEILSLNCINSIDVHPTQPWILICGAYGKIRIWDYRAKENLDFSQLTLTGDSTVAKFIARKQLFVAGTRESFMDVYCLSTKQRLKHFKAHNDGCIMDLAIHPTEPYVLSASDKEGNVKLWDWEKDWACARIFELVNFHVHKVIFHPTEINRFAASGDAGIKFCSLLPGSPYVESYDDQSRTCQLHYFAEGDKLYLIMGCSDGTVNKIRDLHGKSFVKIVFKVIQNNLVQTVKGVHSGKVTAICSHPKNPVLATGSVDGTVCLWNSAALRPERIFNFDLGRVNDVNVLCMDGSTRLVIAHDEGLAMIKIDGDEPGASIRPVPPALPAMQSMLAHFLSMVQIVAAQVSTFHP